MQRTRSFYNLPIELVRLSFSHLLQPDLLAIATTSRHFYAVAKDLPNYYAALSLDTSGVDSFEICDRFQDFASRVDNARQHAMPLALFVCILSEDLEGWLAEQELNELHFTTVLKVHFFDQLPSLLPRLVKAHVVMPFAYSKRAIDALQDAAPVLKALHFDFSDRKASERSHRHNLENLFSGQAPSLAHVRFIGVYTQSHTPAFSNVRSVLYDSCADTEIQQIFVVFPKLKCLTVEELWDGGIDAHPGVFPSSLQSLDFGLQDEVGISTAFQKVLKDSSLTHIHVMLHYLEICDANTNILRCLMHPVKHGVILQTTPVVDPGDDGQWMIRITVQDHGNKRVRAASIQLRIVPWALTILKDLGIDTSLVQ